MTIRELLYKLFTKLAQGRHYFVSFYFVFILLFIAPLNIYVLSNKSVYKLDSLEGILWFADHENGNISQWRENEWKGINGGAFDSGKCYRPKNGTSEDIARSGKYAIKMTIDSTEEAACRQFRNAETAKGYSLYYSAWFYFPQNYIIKGWSNFAQFKAVTDKLKDPIWLLLLSNRSDGSMYLVLEWRGDVNGPFKGNGKKQKHYRQQIMNIPINRWFNVEIYIKQATGFTGKITVWQDGIKIYELNNVITKYVGGEYHWSVNHYGVGIVPNPSTIYIDDAAISTKRIGGNLYSLWKS